MIAHVPPPDLTVPPAIREIAAGDTIRPTWRNEGGGLTFELIGTDARRFAKWAPAGSDITFDAEALRLDWASEFIRVPRPLEAGADSSGRWLVTAALSGQSAVSPRWLAEPERAAAAIGAGLRALHDRLPVDACPFSWSAEHRVARICRDDPKEWHPEEWHPDHAGLDPGTAAARLAEPPPVDKLVVCQGDACAPNTLIGDDGHWSGHVDLGDLGVADRWADLAVATWSVDWNYGPGWAPTLLDAYGIAPDAERTSYYRLLWDLSS